MSQCPACAGDIIEGEETCDNCGCDLTYLSKPKAVSSVDRSLHKEPIRSLRKHAAVVVPNTRKVRDVIASLVTHRDGCAVVVNAAGKIVGVFSERDLLRKLAGRDAALLDDPVDKHMTPDPVTVEASAPIAYALHHMDVGGYRHLPLVENGKPVGMVSVRDIMVFIANRFLTDIAPA